MEGSDQLMQSLDLRAVPATGLKTMRMRRRTSPMQARQANFISTGTYIHQLLMQIKTGEQAISFFAKYGSNTPIKFLNCNRKPIPPDHVQTLRPDHSQR